MKLKAKTIKSKKIKGQKLIDCSQKRCGYLVEKTCRACEECKAPPLKVDEGCVRCFNCENKEGELRFEDENAKKNDEEIKEKLKDLFSKIKEKVEQEQKGKPQEQEEKQEVAEFPIIHRGHYLG